MTATAQAARKFFDAAPDTITRRLPARARTPGSASIVTTASVGALQPLARSSASPARLTEAPA